MDSAAPGISHWNIRGDRVAVSPITHALAAWCLGEAAPRLSLRERGFVVLAGVAPDLDGLGMATELLTRNARHPLLWWSEYHHLLAHNLCFALLASAVAALIAKGNRAVIAGLAFLTVHLHLVCDLVGSRGPDNYEWPIPYLYPFSRTPSFAWTGQWRLNAWQNMTITAVLMAATMFLARRRDYSIVGLFSSRADRALVAALRNRFPGRAVGERAD